MHARAPLEEFLGDLPLELRTETPMPSHGLCSDKPASSVQSHDTQLSSFRGSLQGVAQGSAAGAGSLLRAPINKLGKAYVMLKEKPGTISGIARAVDLGTIASSFAFAGFLCKAATHIEPLGWPRGTFPVGEEIIHQYAILMLL